MDHRRDDRTRDRESIGLMEAGQIGEGSQGVHHENWKYYAGRMGDDEG